MKNRRRGKRRPQKKWSNRVSDHFSKRDFKCPYCETIEGCRSTFRLSLGLVGGLELLRSKAGQRINIIKGYECVESAEKLTSFKQNYHCAGIAADITIDTLSPKDVFLLAESVLEFNGIGLDVTNNMVHVDTRKTDERVLWVEKEGEVIALTDENRSTYFGD